MNDGMSSGLVHLSLALELPLEPAEVFFLLLDPEPSGDLAVRVLKSARGFSAMGGRSLPVARPEFFGGSCEAEGPAPVQGLSVLAGVALLVAFMKRLTQARP